MLKQSPGYFLKTSSLMDRITFWEMGRPIIIGVGIGILVGLDLLMAYLFPLHLFNWRINQWVPFPFALIFSILFILCYIIAVNREYLFSKRYTIAMVLLIIPAMLTGINIGPLDPSDLAFLIVFVFLVM